MSRRPEIECRYRDNGDGTATDYDTGLQWELKNSANGVINIANPHDVDNGYRWGSVGTSSDGTLFTEFLDRLNTCSFAPSFFSNFGFAGHCDWRLPTRAELLALLSCGASSCVHPVFSVTKTTTFYWTSTADARDADDAWVVSFGGSGSVGPTPKNGPTALPARAVRVAF